MSEVGAIIHPVYFVPETMQVSQLLKELQRRRMSMAIVVDEHGGVDGLVTMEDLIEEMVGEIHDEYDTAAKPVVRLKDGDIIRYQGMKLTVVELEGRRIAQIKVEGSGK